MLIGVALGSNIGDRFENLRAGRKAISQILGVNRELQSSPIYETEPVDCEPGTPGFLNAVILFEFEGEPEPLMRDLQAIEKKQGRPERRPKNAPRPIDLDILFAGDRIVAESAMVIPHPRLHVRRFVLKPLADVGAALRLPGFKKTVGEMLEELNDPTEVVKVCDVW